MFFKRLVNLQARRVSAGLSINDLARRSTMSYADIEREEGAARLGSAGTSKFNDQNAAQLAAALGTTTSDLRGL